MARTRDAAVAELAATQHSAFSYRQACELGWSPSALHRHLERGVLVRPLPGVYRPAGAAPTWHGDVMAAVLWAGDGAVASHRTAAALHRIDGIGTRGVIDITVPRGRFPTAKGVVTHRSMLMDPADLTLVDGIAATTPSRVLIDSGLVVPKLSIELGLEDCQRRGLVGERWLLRRLERLGAPLRRGSKPLVDILLERDPLAAPLESVLELGVWDLIRSSDLPRPVRQHEVAVDGRKYRLDFAYPDDLVDVEAAGFRWHSGRLKWGVDQRRAGALASVGWRIVPVTWSDVQHEPDVVLRLIRGALQHGSVSAAERQPRCHVVGTLANP